MPFSSLSSTSAEGVQEGENNLPVPPGSSFTSHCSFLLSTLHSALHFFYHNEAWDLCVVLDSSGVNSENVTQILITEWLWGRMARGSRRHLFILFFFNTPRWPVQIADRGSSGKGGGCCCPGIFIPGKFPQEILCDRSLTLTEKKRECWGTNRNCNHSMLEGNACSSREKKNHYIQRLFFVEDWKETSIAL